MMGYQVTLFESLPVLGGMLSVGIPEYRLPRDILQTELSIIQQLGVEIKLNTKVGTDVKLSNLRRDFDAIFLAIGAHQGKRLGIQNEDVEGLVDGVEFLRKVNLGKRMEAKDDKVAIVGGGNVASDCARTCLRLGFKDVQILYRRSREEMPAIREEIQRAEEEGVKIIFLVAPTRVLIDKRRVKGIECIRTKLGQPDESRRMRPIPVEGSEFVVETNAIISAVGEQPDLSVWKDAEISLPIRDELIVADPVTLETGVLGIFAGGDAVTGPAYVIDAVAAGRKAAISIDRYLRGENLAANREGEGPQETNLSFNIECVTRKTRQTPSILSLDQRQANFQEVEKGLSMTAAKEEAGRCLACECWECIKPLACPAMTRDRGKVVIDNSICPGCGICAQICAAKAIVPEST